MLIYFSTVAPGSSRGLVPLLLLKKAPGPATQKTCAG